MELKHPRLSNNGRSSFSPIINREKKKFFKTVCMAGIQLWKKDLLQLCYTE